MRTSLRPISRPAKREPAAPAPAVAGRRKKLGGAPPFGYARLPRRAAGVALAVACTIPIILARRAARRSAARGRGEMRMSSNQRRALACAAVLAGASPAWAARYTFTNVADSTGPYALFDGHAINNAGTVAFWARLDSNGFGI